MWSAAFAPRLRDRSTRICSAAVHRTNQHSWTRSAHPEMALATKCPIQRSARCPDSIAAGQKRSRDAPMLDDDNRAVKRRAEIPSRRSAIRELTTGRRSDVISPGRQGGLARVMLAGLRRPPGEDCVAKVGKTANSPCSRLVGDFARSEAMHIKCMLWFESWLLSQTVRSQSRLALHPIR